MNTFNIQNTTFNNTLEVFDSLQIKSFPKDYNVYFKSFNNDFKDNEVILVDKNVQSLYNINHTKLISIEATEENKSIETVLKVCKQLMDFSFDKGSTLVVIGGGIIQDIGAYTAKTFKRGVKWKYYPTTLLSQCDSCIGGKTALNFLEYKNQLALFSAPDEVIIDINFLNTLTPQDITSGYGEIVKLFLIGGQYYIDNFDTFDMKTTIFHSLNIKKAVIEKDEFESNERKSLNYGHSFGHVIEPMVNYSIPHGEAVMLGIELINKIFTKSQKITSLINKFTSLNKIKHLNVTKLVNGLKTDKKVTNGIISLVIVPKPGNTVFVNHLIDESLEKLVHEILIN